MKIEDVYPLSPMQEGLYYHWLADPASYIEQMIFTLKGDLKPALVEKSYAALVARHAVLRTCFTQKTGKEVLQIVQKEVQPVFRFEDLSEGDAGAALAIRITDRNTPFDLSWGSQMRLTLIKLPGGAYDLVWTQHHILMDGWCVGLLMAEFLKLYEGLLFLGRLPDLGPAYPYSSYIRWLMKAGKQQSLDHWKKYLEGYETHAILPGLASRHSGQFQPGQFTFVLDSYERQALENICRATGITESVFIQTIWGLLLCRYNDTDDAVFGTVVSGRPSEIESIENIIGLFINTVPVRIRIEQDTSVTNLLKQMMQGYISGAGHHHVQLAQIQAASTGGPLFNHLLVFENYPVEDIAWQSQYASGNGMPQLVKSEMIDSAHFDFSLVVIPGRHFTIQFNYNRLALSDEAAGNIQQHLLCVLRQVLNNPDMPVSGVTLLTPADQKKQLDEFYPGRLLSPVKKTVFDIFCESCEKHSGAAAIRTVGGSVSYRQLRQMTAQVAAALSRHGVVVPGVVIALQLPVGPWLVACTMAVFEAGGVYMPLDMELPAGRLDFILSDSQCGLLVNDQWLETHLPPAADTENLPAEPAVPLHEYSPAYIIYTSGSTGRPKGVLVNHGCLYHFIQNCLHQFSKDAGCSFLALASPAFDISLFEMLFPLTTGGCLIIPGSNALKEPWLLANDLLSAEAFQAVPAVLDQITTTARLHGTDAFSHVRHIYTGGDSIPDHVLRNAREVFRNADIQVLYGPTEATIFVSGIRYSAGYPAAGMKGTVIGKPNNNALIYITDRAMRLMPPGVTGEICIGGSCVAVGYLNRQDLTEQKFLPDPFSQNGRIYRSGDLGRWLPDGTIEFMGRSDDQVKIRGYRIEPGEVQQAVQQLPGVENALVLAVKNRQDENHLVCWFTGNNAPSVTEIQNYLRQRLPAYMIPTAFIPLQAWPLTTNGKVDKKNLPMPDSVSDKGRPLWEAPQNETEKQLASLWEELLETERVGRNDHFFKLGGHSLKITRLAGQLYKQLGIKITVKDVFENPVLKDMADVLRRTGFVGLPEIPVAPEMPDYPLSSSQRRIWVLHKFAGNNPTYHMPGIVELPVGIDVDTLEKALFTLIQRHEILRTVFCENSSGEARQVILSPGQIRFKLVITGMPAGGDAVQAAKLAEDLITRPFDLEVEPPFRCALLRYDEGVSILVYVLHHIAGDGWSMGLLNNELIHIYNALCDGKLPVLEPLQLQYKDFATWQQQQLLTAESGRQAQWWLQQLKDPPPALNIPGWQPRPAVKTYNGGMEIITLPLSMLDGLKTISETAGCSLFVTLLAGVKTLLYRYAGQEDIIVGMPAAGREHPVLQQQVGFYVNTLPLRTRLSGSMYFPQLQQLLKQAVLGALQHQDYPFDELVEKLAANEDLSRSAIFDVMVSFQEGPGKQPSLAGAADSVSQTLLQTISVTHTTAKFDFTFNFAETVNGLQMALEYNSDVYNPVMAQAMLRHLNQLFSAVISGADATLARLPMLTAGEEHMLLTGFNNTTTDYPRSATIQSLFAGQATNNQNRIALRCGNSEWTYQQLDRISSAFAHWLRDEYAIATGDVVAVCIPRSDWVVITIMGILKAGAAYLPMEPDYPESRRTQMLQAGNCKTIVEAPQLLSFQENHRQYPVSAPGQEATAETLAYIMFTSGSTGLPKGVMINHRAVIRLVKNNQFLLLKGDEVILSTGALSFDATTFEFWGALLNGGTLVLTPKELLLDSTLLSIEIIEKQVNTMWFTAGWFNQLVEEDPELFSSLRTIIAGGDKLSQPHVQRLLQYKPGLHLINGYGPTENTTFSLTFNMQGHAPSVIPLGKPISNSTAFIFSPEMMLCPVGVLGEIYVGGDGLSHGYAGDSTLTAAKFIEHPLQPGKKIYRTGDLGRWREDGHIEFYGRVDNQVKIRGYRVETGEIEAVLLELEKVEQAVVATHTNAGGEKELLAWFTAGRPISAAELRSYLISRLPNYMIPAGFMQLQHIPLTGNGKVDRNALPQMEAAAFAVDTEYAEPETAVQNTLTIIWQEILGISRVGIRDNFFMLGGQSLKMARMMARVNQQYGIKTGIPPFFKDPTIEGLAVQVDFLTEQKRLTELKAQLTEFEI